VVEDPAAEHRRHATAQLMPNASRLRAAVPIPNRECPAHSRAPFDHSTGAQDRMLSDRRNGCDQTCGQERHVESYPSRAEQRIPLMPAWSAVTIGRS